MKFSIKSLILISIFILLLVTASYSLYILLFQGKSNINIINNSKHYTLSYKETPEIKKTLTKLGVKTINPNSSQIKINSITIKLVDEPQQQFVSFNDKKEITHSASYTISKDGELNVILFLHRRFIVLKSNVKLLENFTLESALQAIFTASYGDKLTPHTLSKEFPALLKIYTQYPENNPFKIKIKK